MKGMMFDPALPRDDIIDLARGMCNHRLAEIVSITEAQYADGVLDEIYPTSLDPTRLRAQELRDEISLICTNAAASIKATTNGEFTKFHPVTNEDVYAVRRELGI